MAKQKKSADSKLVDAKLERAKNQEIIHPEAAEVPALVEDAAERRIEARRNEVTQDDIEELRKQHQDEMKRLMEIVNKLQQNPTAFAQPAGPNIMEPRPVARCPVCSQVLMTARGRGVCNGDHVMIRVTPMYHQMWKYFQGVEINGCKYQGLAHVPRSIAHEVLSTLRRWESKELEKFMPGGRIFGEHENLMMSSNLPVLGS